MSRECQLELKNAGKPYPRTCGKCGISGPCKNGLDYAQLLKRIEDLEDRAYKLAYAITGGEDAPGYLNSIDTEVLVKMVKNYQDRLSQLEWEKYSPIVPLESVTKCPTCKMEFRGAVGYVCTNLKCPLFTVVSC